MQPELIEEFCKGLTEIKEGVTRTDKNVTDVNTALKAVQAENDRLQSEFTQLRRLHLSTQHATRNTQYATRNTQHGLVSDECAAHLGATFILQCAKSGKLETLAQSAATRDALLTSARQTLGIEVRTALSTTDIPLPIGYSGELCALIAQFGVVRKAMFSCPRSRPSSATTSDG